MATPHIPAACESDWKAVVVKLTDFDDLPITSSLEESLLMPAITPVKTPASAPIATTAIFPAGPSFSKEDKILLNPPEAVCAPSAIFCIEDDA